MRSDDHEDTHGKEHMQNMMEGMTDSLTTHDYTEKKKLSWPAVANLSWGRWRRFRVQPSDPRPAAPAAVLSGAGAGLWQSQKETTALTKKN